MKRLLHCLPVLSLLTLAACGGEPAAPAAPTAASPPLEPPKALSEVDVAAAVRGALGDDYDARYFGTAVDLDGDGRDEVLAYVAGPMVCGTGGCPLYVFTPGEGRYDLVSQVSVVQVPVRVSAQSTQGWRDLVVGIGGGGIPAADAVLRFDGKAYPSNPTVPPAEPAASLEGTEVVIGEFNSYTEGKPLTGEPAATR